MYSIVLFQFEQGLVVQLPVGGGEDEVSSVH
jgi:hypothetical protein